MCVISSEFDYVPTLLWMFSCDPATLIMHSQAAVYSLQQILCALSNGIPSGPLNVGVSKWDSTGEVAWENMTASHMVVSEFPILTNMPLHDPLINKHITSGAYFVGTHATCLQGLRENRHVV